MNTNEPLTCDAFVEASNRTAEFNGRCPTLAIVGATGFYELKEDACRIMEPDVAKLCIHNYPANMMVIAGAIVCQSQSSRGRTIEFACVPQLQPRISCTISHNR